MAVLLTLGALLGWLLAPDAIKQFKELAERLPQAVGQLKERLQVLGWFHYLVENLPSASDLGAGEGKLFSKLGGFFSGGIQVVTGFVLILFLGLYLAAAPEVYVRGILHLFPIPKRVRVREILGELGSTLRTGCWASFFPWSSSEY